MKKISYLLIPILACLFGCHSNNESAKVALSTDSANQPELNTKLVKADSAAVANRATQLSLFLSKYYQKDIAQNLLDSGSRRFIYSEYDLNQDGKKETLVGLNGSYFCGSGGCTALLLDNEGNLLSKFTVAQYPFKVAVSVTNNWKDLVVESRGKQHVLKFNGKTYPSNPSVQPEFSGTLTAGVQLLELPPHLDQWHTF